MSADVPSCPVCLLKFDANVIVPMVAGCGHSVCFGCVVGIGNPYQCPICRRVISQSLSKNFALRDVLAIYRTLEAKAIEDAPLPQEKKQTTIADERPLLTDRDGGIFEEESLILNARLQDALSQPRQIYDSKLETTKTILCQHKTHGPGHLSLVIIDFHIRASVSGYLNDGFSGVEMYVNINHVQQTPAKISYKREFSEETFYMSYQLLCELPNNSKVDLMLHTKNVKEVQIEDSYLYIRPL